MKTMITLGDMADKGMTMLEVACRHCDRRGRLSIARLITEHGREGYGDPPPDHRARLSEDAGAAGVDL